jgi:lysophospholipase L1-like esterase
VKGLRVLDRLLGQAVRLVLAAVALLALGEIVARLLGAPTYEERIAAGGPGLPQDSEAYAPFPWRRRYFEDLAHRQDGFKYVPFVGWRPRDMATSLLNVRNNQRVTWTPPIDGVRRDVRIFFFGASTAYGIEVPDEYTLPSQLAKRLDSGSRVDRFLVQNDGVPAFVIDNEVQLLLKLLSQGERPDVVVFYDGINEILVKVASGLTHYFEQDFRTRLFHERGVRAQVLGAMQTLARRSRLVQWVRRPSPNELAEDVPPLITDPASLERNAALALDNYAGNASLVRELGRAYGFRTVFFWQPSMYVTGKVLTPEEQRLKEWADVYRPGLKLANAATAALLKSEHFFEREGIVDLRGALDGVTQTTFIDVHHVTVVGNEAIAAAMAPWIMMALEPAPAP